MTTFRVFSDAYDQAGDIGSSESTLQSVEPFFIEPKLPLEVTAGDKVMMPLSVTNNTARGFADLKITVNGNRGKDAIEISEQAGSGKTASLAAGSSLRKLYVEASGETAGDVNLTINASAGGFADSVTRTLRVRPAGFPIEVASGGVIDAGSPIKKEIVIPDSVRRGSVETFATIYPSPMANLTDAVTALMREPNGCFEQTSSTNYPLAMAEQYFTTHQNVDPQLISRSGELLTKGYQRLTGFETTTKGFEWFGGANPGHEALTAYGLMEFADMQSSGLGIVDNQMISRTRDWLISREDGKGGFERNSRSADSFGRAPELTTNAYIVWALLKSGQGGLDREISAVKTAAKNNNDSYVQALAANICALSGDHETARGFMQDLAHKQSQDGSVVGAETSITSSGGQALAIEATSLAALAWMSDPSFAGNVRTAIKFLDDSCKGGRFASTQSTVLALKAIIADDKAQARPKAPGSLILMVDGKQWGAPLAFTADSSGPLALPDFSEALMPGKHEIAVQMQDGSQMPFSFGVRYNSDVPASDPQCKLDLQTTLKDVALTEGAITDERVIVNNKSKELAASPVAIIGIPGGLEVRHDQLKELVKGGKIAAYEVNGREVVLYWRTIKPGGTVDVSLSLTAAVPGAYAAPASRVYEYYTDEFKQWVAGASVNIAPK